MLRLFQSHAQVFDSLGRSSVATQPRAALPSTRRAAEVLPGRAAGPPPLSLLPSGTARGRCDGEAPGGCEAGIEQRCVAPGAWAARPAPPEPGGGKGAALSGTERCGFLNANLKELAELISERVRSESRPGTSAVFPFNSWIAASCSWAAECKAQRKAKATRTQTVQLIHVQIGL